MSMRTLHRVKGVVWYHIYKFWPFNEVKEFWRGEFQHKYRNNERFSATTGISKYVRHESPTATPMVDVDDTPQSRGKIGIAGREEGNFRIKTEPPPSMNSTRCTYDKQTDETERRHVLKYTARHVTWDGHTTGERDSRIQVQRSPMCTGQVNWVSTGSLGIHPSGPLA
jgi:hypothetical protein